VREIERYGFLLIIEEFNEEISLFRLEIVPYNEVLDALLYKTKTLLYD